MIGRQQLLQRRAGGSGGAAAAARQPARCGRQAPQRQHQQQQQRRRLLVVAAEQQSSSGGGDLFADVKRVAKKIQGALPIVGLLSRLSAPSGGFDEIAYPEFCRAAFDSADQPTREAVVEMERRYGKLGQSRWLYMALWMAKHGAGLLPPRNMILAARRMRVTQDVEIEMDRFTQQRDAALAKYGMVARPQPKAGDALALAVDAIAVLCMGLKDGQPVPEADEPVLAAILGFTWPDAGPELILESIRGRPARVSAYNA